MPDELKPKIKKSQALAPRLGEKIGGGWIIVSRHPPSSRIIFSKFPYEHESIEDATIQAKRLAEQNPGRIYLVMQAVASIAA